MANNKTIEVKLGSDGVMQYDVYSTANTPITKRYADTFDNAEGPETKKSMATGILIGFAITAIVALTWKHFKEK